MKLLLSIAIPAWVGWAGGALTDGVFSDFWSLWLLCGILLIVVTSVYIYERRSE